MNFVKIEKEPRLGHKRGELKARLDEFMRMRTKTVEVDWSDTYKNVRQAQMNLSRGAKAGAFPIDVRSKKGKVYLIRRDM